MKKTFTEWLGFLKENPNINNKTEYDNIVNVYYYKYKGVVIGI